MLHHLRERIRPMMLDLSTVLYCRSVWYERRRFKVAPDPVANLYLVRLPTPSGFRKSEPKQTEPHHDRRCDLLLLLVRSAFKAVVVGNFSTQSMHKLL